MALGFGPLTAEPRSRAHFAADALALVLALGVASTATGQPAPGRPQPAGPAGPAQPAQGTPAQPKGPSELGPGESDDKKPDPFADELAAQPGGLTPDSVAKEAVATSPNVRSKEAQLEDARGGKEEALVGYFPR